ncbi:MAG TPA: glutathione S-transferase family protein [Candidatus Polarisedimenticolia bacterium]|nr:glutathione S-transferase family protein [Candidatus Polarisedimenticolia bacterium]
MPTLYQFEGSPWCWKVRMVLAEKGIPFQTVVPRDRENDPGFRRMTPVGKVPVLVMEDGVTVFESTVINEYLEERFPSPPLLPADPAGRARARMIEEVADAYLAPAVRSIVLAGHRFESGRWVRRADPDPRQAEAGLAAASVYLDHLDAELEGRRHLAGEFSLADIALVPPLARGGRIAQLPLPARWPRLAGWLERTLARPSVASTLPPPLQILDPPV